jgi:hypothetical protein
MLVLLRSRGRRRCLSAIALFAWLMLAAAPFGAWVHATAAMPAAAMAGHAPAATMPMGAGSCCADHPDPSAPATSHACHCALSCAAVLPSVQAALAGTLVISGGYAPPRPLEAPLAGFAPPLRPPLT